jgi:hypothetical protein
LRDWISGFFNCRCSAPLTGAADLVVHFCYFSCIDAPDFDYFAFWFWVKTRRFGIRFGIASASAAMPSLDAEMWAWYALTLIVVVARM